MPAPSIKKPPQRRPILLTLILLVFGLWAVLGWLRFAQVLIQRELILATLSASLFWYLLLAGALWGLAALPVLWGLLRRRGWALMALWIAAILYPAFYWIERIFLWRDPAAGENWPFMLALTVLWLGLTAWTSCSVRVRQFINQDQQADGRRA